MTKQDIDALIRERFGALPPKLKLAARYVLDSPTEVAVQSMRSIAASAGLLPGAMLRFARELGFRDYEDFKSVYVDWVAGQNAGLMDRTLQLRNRSKRQGAGKSLADFLHTERVNLDKTLSTDNEPSWVEAQRALAKANHIYVLGVRSLFPVAYYFHYVLSTFRPGVTLVAGMGGTGVDELRRIGSRDALVCFTSLPYSVISVQATALAEQRGATLIAVSDSHLSPVAEKATVTILAPNANLAVFPSVVPHMAVAHTLAQLMVSHGGEEVLAEARNSDAQLKQFGVYTR